MYSFKLCVESRTGGQVRRVAGGGIEVSTYAKFVAVCQSMCPKIMQLGKKVLVKYTDSENDAVIADSEESFQGIHAYCAAMVNKFNVHFCLKLVIDFVGEDENGPDSPVDGDQFVKIETPIAAPAKFSADSVAATVQISSISPAAVAIKLPKEESVPSTATVPSLASRAIGSFGFSVGPIQSAIGSTPLKHATTVSTVSAGTKQEIAPSTASATAKQESAPSTASATSKQESAPITASATATVTPTPSIDGSIGPIGFGPKQAIGPAESTPAKQASTASTANATTKEEIKETKCRGCGARTSNKCSACKTTYFCSHICEKSQTYHTRHECRVICITRWKESGVSRYPGSFPVGTKVFATFKRSRRYYDGFIASFDEITKRYAVKYDDGDFSDSVHPDDMNAVCLPKEPKPIGLLEEQSKCLTPQATAIIKEIFQRYSEDGLVEVSTREKGIVNQEMRFMSLTHFKSFASDFFLEKNPAPTRVVEVYYKYATGIANNNVSALLEEGFIRYYTEQAKTKNRSVWYDIFSMGYDATLQRIQTNLIRKGEVVLYRPSVQCDFEQAVVLNIMILRDVVSLREVTDYQIMLLKNGSEKRVSYLHNREMIRKCYNVCHKCRQPLTQVSLHSFCCCDRCEEPRPDGSAIHSISI